MTTVSWQVREIRRRTDSSFLPAVLVPATANEVVGILMG
ncbi:hypothetical protein FB108_0941 [Brevibacterium jeotgali]|nr:hypothetical protein FB108_0941 [Brevibacterium jeotgali]